MKSSAFPITITGWIAYLWGLGGFLWLLIYAVARLWPIALDAFSVSLQWWHWVVLIGNTSLMAYAEGFKGFQRGYSPRVVARANYLRQQPGWLNVVLAPFFCMQYYAAPPRRMRVSWLLTVMIIALVLLFHRLPQPWRGILDAGVVVGLSWGTLATVITAWRYRYGNAPHTLPAIDPEVR